MLHVRLRWCALALLAPAVGLLPAMDLQAEPPVPTHKDTSVAEHTPRPKVDRHGDLMPAAALNRFGTPRFRQGDAVTAIVFSPDNQMLASAGNDHKVRLWEAATGKQHTEIPQEWATCLAFAPDGKSVAVGSGIGSLRLFDLDGKELRKFAGHTGRVLAIAFSSDGSLLASTGTDQLVKVWEAGTANEAHVLDGHQDVVNALAFVPGTTHLVTGSGDQSLRIWNAADGNLIRRIDGKAAILGLAISSDGKTIAATEGNLVKLWNRSDGAELKSLDAKLPVSRVAFSADNALLVASAADATMIWDLNGDKKLRTVPRAEGGGGPFALSSDSKILACAGGQAALRLWDVKSGEELRFHAGHQAEIVSADLSADGKLLVSADVLGVVRLWEAESGKPLRQAAFTPPVAVALCDDGRTLAITRHEDVLLQDVDTGKELKVLKVEGDQPLSACWVGTTLAVGYRGHSIRLWDVDKGEAASRLAGHTYPIVQLAFSAAGKMLASADQAGNIRVWDSEKANELRRLGNVGPLPVLSFSPSGAVLATSNTDGMISLWNVATGAEEKQLLGHDGPVRGLAFAPDGKTLVSSGQDHAVRLWELASGKQVLNFAGHGGPVQWVRFTGEGRNVLSASSDCTLLSWDLISKFEGMRVGPNELDNLWKELASNDGPPAYRAAWTLVAAPGQSVPFVRDRLRTFIGVDPQRINKLIANLNHDDFMVRERATEELEKLGQLAEQALQKSMVQTSDLEVLRRIERILEKQMAPDVSWSQERLRVLRAINVLEKIGSTDARTILESLARGAPEEVLMREARASLDRLKR